MAISSGQSSSGSSGGSDYMSGIASIGNALNNTHLNVLQTLKDFGWIKDKQMEAQKEMLNKQLAVDQYRAETERMGTNMSNARDKYESGLAKNQNFQNNQANLRDESYANYRRFRNQVV